jgi:hypothetical protein
MAVDQDIEAAVLGEEGEHRHIDTGLACVPSGAKAQRRHKNPRWSAVEASRFLTSARSYEDPPYAAYTLGMADPITFRPTVEDTANLAILTAEGTSPTHAIRHALEIAAHKKRQEDLRADAARLATNPEYQAEIRAVREELDELRAW